MALAIPIITEFDGKGIGKAITEFKNLESASDKIGFAAKNAAKVAAVGFAGLAAAGAAVGGILFKAAQAAAEDQAAQVKLASQIKATSDATDVQIKGVENYIDKTQRAVGVADDKLRPAFGRLIAATKDTTKAQDLLNIALDVSAATGKDVEAVAGALAKAQEGNFTALDRLGIGYEKGEAKARGFLGVQKDLEERFSGAALTKAQTYEGTMDRLKITLGELQESIGYKVLPIIQNLTEAALKIADAFGEKGAAVIANNFATVEDALAAAHAAHDSLPPALAKKIIAGADYLSIAPKLVRVARDAPLPKVDLSMPKAPADLSKLYQIKDQYGLGASIDRLIAALGW